MARRANGLVGGSTGSLASTSGWAVWRVSSRCPQVEHKPGQAASHRARRGKLVRIFCRKTSSRLISWCSSTNSRSGTSGTCSGRPVRMSVLGRNSSSNSPWISTDASSRQRAHSSTTCAWCSLCTRMPSDVRMRRAWPLTGPCRCNSPATSGIGSEKSNSRTMPGPNSSNWETFTETIGDTKKAARRRAARYSVEYRSRDLRPAKQLRSGRENAWARLELRNPAVDGERDLADLLAQLLQHLVGVGVGLAADVLGLLKCALLDIGGALLGEASHVVVGQPFGHLG